MSETPKRPILYKGEAYSHPIEKKKVVIPKQPDISFEEARVKILESLEIISRQIDEMPEDLKLPNETIVIMKVSAEVADKNFYPSSVLYPSTQGSQLEEVGSRIIKRKVLRGKDREDIQIERIFYIRTTEDGLESFGRKLSQKQSIQAQNFMLDIRRISELNLAQKNDRVSGFEDGWKEGRVEATLHPFSMDRSFTMTHFKEFLRKNNLPIDQVKFRQYGSEGLTFVSFMSNISTVRKLSEYNPLRSIHPLTFRNFTSPNVLSVKKGLPRIANAVKRPSIVVGVIDGGYIPGNVGLDQYVEAIDSVTGNLVKDFAEHGSLVSSAILFGSINGIENSENLDNPEIYVRNFRVLSDQPSGPDLYNVIDTIEKIVPENTDIQVYNISLGPIGPIDDTEVHRFTYALDLLSKTHNVLFCVAVGNQGHISGYERIQSPSDIVNGLAIGAYSLTNGTVKKADYSCVGPGREGNKMKPDIMAFGGCVKNPLQLVYPSPGIRAFLQGTSFAAPLASSVAGRLIGKSKGVLNALTARALIIHGAHGNTSTNYTNEMGHGMLALVEDLTECVEKSYTLIFEGEIERGKYREFNIPWIKEITVGKAVFKWTLAVQSSVDPNSPEDYTTSSVEMTFHPNSHKYNFKKDLKTKSLDITEFPEEARSLEKDGWKKSVHPSTDSPEKQLDTSNSLRGNLKWDSIDTRSVSKFAKSIKDPIFQVHAICRGHRRESAKVKFAIILSIEAEKASVDIYSKVIAKYANLTPIKMDIQARVTAGENKSKQ
jgi:hypothetical protein